MAQLQNPPRELKSAPVLLRFCVRISILIGFSAFGGVGFGLSLAALLAILCAVRGVVRREAPFGAVLNYWDEAMAYAALYFLTVGLNLSAAPV